MEECFQIYRRDLLQRGIPYIPDGDNVEKIVHAFGYEAKYGRWSLRDWANHDFAPEVIGNALSSKHSATIEFIKGNPNHYRNVLSLTVKPKSVIRHAESVSDWENEAFGHLARFCPHPVSRYAST